MLKEPVGVYGSYLSDTELASGEKVALAYLKVSNISMENKLIRPIASGNV